MKEKKIPAEVVWAKEIEAAWGLGMIYLTLDTVKKLDDIADRYPSYFPAKYARKKALAAVPDHVHEAYHREWQKEILDAEPVGGSEGLYSAMLESHPTSNKPFSLKQYLEQMDTHYKEQRQKADLYEQRCKAIWDKHYGPYNIAYNS